MTEPTAAGVRELVVEALAELLVPPPRRALVLFAGGLLGFEDAVASLRRLQATGCQLDYRLTPSAERVLDQDLIAGIGMREVSRRMVEEHDLLIVPTLTANLAAKVAHGVTDCLGSNLFSEFIMSNKLVIAARNAVCPDGADKISWFPNMPPAYADLLRGNLATMASFGVRLPLAGTLCRTAQAAWDRRDAARRAPVVAALGTSLAGLRARSDRSATPGTPPATAGPAGREAASTTIAGEDVRAGLVSHQVVQQLPPGTQLRVGAATLVTAMAKDLAAARSIRISREV
ncbi:flavoprotein [Micropruina sonneratiae]|uniref:flavoprotein n=1 Tax=Micropruina sonneratiae TaxID=2986940 RepID=UPI0022278ACC|nr:flavoprotein [Micropruina sp. KQZ13P-5]MCW3157263.1 flavoprotein domain protein [Micropruina sp. KQZ13P-5]